MKPINKTAQKTFTKILDILGTANHTRIDRTNGTFMPLVVERLSENMVSLTHYGEQNGDAMADPDMTFWLAPDGRIYPCTFRNDYMHVSQVAVQFDSNGKYSYRPKLQRSLATFAGQWLGNIKEQQHI